MIRNNVFSVLTISRLLKKSDWFDYREEIEEFCDEASDA